MKTTNHRHYFQPYVLWIAAAALVLALLAAPAKAQVLHRPPTAVELAAWIKAQAEAKAAAKAERRAKLAPVRASVARARVFQIRARLVKLDHRVDAWEGDEADLQRRLWQLGRSSRAVKGSTRRRNLSSLVSDVKTKLARCRKAIKDARAEQNRLLAEREACYATIEEARISQATRKRR